jgi:TolB-like protein/Flp pilus assembly protein TadD
VADKGASFLEELRQRNVFRVGFAYAVAAWLIAQVADLVLESFEAPSWVMRAVLVSLGLGFAAALLLAWVFEITPEGIKRETEVDRTDPGTHGSGRRLDLFIIVLLAGALIYFVAAHDWTPDSPDPVSTGPKSIAVLPFENMSDNRDNAFFASGVHEDILTHLSKIADLRVIARSSVEPFAGDRRGVRAIADDLGVAHVVEGSVRRADNRVRVTAQLIDARSEQQIWAESYDRSLSDVFEIQSAIAREISRALQAELSSEEAESINRAPTSSIEAYEKYAEARAIRRDSAYNAAKIREMAPLLEEAVRLDPEFALAHALLGSVYTNFYWLSIDRTEERLKRARASIDRAFSLQPGLPEARAALAEYYYRGFNNYARALEELKAAHDRFPNNTDILELMGVTQRRLGYWDDAIQSLRAATQLDPGDLGKKHLLMETLTRAQEWDAASAFGDQLLADFPDDPIFRAMRATVYMSGYGELQAAAALLEGMAPRMDPEVFIAELTLVLYTERYDQALALIEEYDALLSLFPDGAGDFLRSWITGFQGDEAASLIYAERVVEALEPQVRSDDIEASSWKLMAAEAHARLGNDQEALRFARAVLAMNPRERDAFEAPQHRAHAARVIALAGEVEEGLDVLAPLVAAPSGPSRWELRLHPVWRFLDDQPRFRALAGI